LLLPLKSIRDSAFRIQDSGFRENFGVIPANMGIHLTKNVIPQFAEGEYAESDLVV